VRTDHSLMPLMHGTYALSRYGRQVRHGSEDRSDRTGRLVTGGPLLPVRMVHLTGQVRQTYLDRGRNLTCQRGKQRGCLLPCRLILAAAQGQDEGQQQGRRVATHSAKLALHLRRRRSLLSYPR
jgi:hypothetical protein